MAAVVVEEAVAAVVVAEVVSTTPLKRTAATVPTGRILPRLRRIPAIAQRIREPVTAPDRTRPWCRRVPSRSNDPRSRCLNITS